MATNSPLDLTYQTLITQFSQLNQQFKSFLNDPEFTIVDSGSIPTLKKIIQNLNEIEYVESVKKYLTLALADADSNLTLGQLIQVTQDPIKLNNGFYKVEDDVDAFILTKQDYSTLYDLGNRLPNPWNYEVIQLVNELGALKVAEITLPLSSIHTHYESIQGNLQFISDDGETSDTNFAIKIKMLQGTSNPLCEYKSVDIVDNDNTFTILPGFSFSHASSVNDITISIWFHPTEKSSLPVSGITTIKLNGINRDLFKIFN